MHHKQNPIVIKYDSILAGVAKKLFYGPAVNSDDSESSEKVLVLELMGPSLLDIIEDRDLDTFSLKTILQIGIQAVRILTRF